MDIDAKLRPLFLLQILKERTDEDNYLTTTQLCDILKREYGLDTHRTTLKSDIEVLRGRVTLSMSAGLHRTSIALLRENLKSPS